MAHLFGWSAALALAWTPLDAADPMPAEPPPPTTLAARPISEAAERMVEKLEDERMAPCRKAIEEGRPCFPITAARRGPDASVREGLRQWNPTGGQSPNRPPTVGEMSEHRPGSGTPPLASVSFDPGCAAKSIVNVLKGRINTFYLYRMRDVLGERVELQDRRLDATKFQGDLEFLGKFDGECEALAAYRREVRKVVTPRSP